MNARVPDAAHADHLAGHVHDLEALQQVPPVVLQGGPVGAELLADQVVDLVRGQAVGGGQVARRDHDRRLADDPVLAVDQLAELGQRLQAVAGVRLRGSLLRPLLRRLRRLLLLPVRLLALRRPFLLLLRRLCPPVRLLFLPGLLLLRRRLGHRAADRGHELVLVQVGVPDVHRPHLRERGHRLPVGPHRRQRRRTRVRLGEPVVAGRDGEAGRHPLHVVLERPGQRLVEVVHVEQQDPLGRGEHAEVRQVRVAAQLGLQAGHRRVRQVRRHDLGRAPVEGERRDHHPAVADRHQVRLAGGVLLLQQADRVRAVRGRPPLRVARQSRPVPGLQTHGFAIVDARMRDLPHGHPAHLPR